LHIVLFEICSAFTHVAACTLAQSPIRDRYPGASDISSPPCLPRLLPAGAVAGGALHPLEKGRLVTAPVESGPSPKPPLSASSRHMSCHVCFVFELHRERGSKCHRAAVTCSLSAAIECRRASFSAFKVATWSSRARRTASISCCCC